MGIDARIMLPKDVSPARVAQALARLAGSPSATAKEGHADSAKAVLDALREEAGLIARQKHELHFADASGNPRMAALWSKGEPSRPEEDGFMAIYPRSNAFWIAAGRGLVVFFGGKLCCDDEGKWEMEVDPAHSAWAKASGSDGGAFQAMESIVPLGAQDLAWANARASYKTSELEQSQYAAPFEAARESSEIRGSLSEKGLGSVKKPSL